MYNNYIFDDIQKLIDNLSFEEYERNKNLIFNIINDVREWIDSYNSLRCNHSLTESRLDLINDFNLITKDYHNEDDELYDVLKEDYEELNDTSYVVFNNSEPIKDIIYNTYDIKHIGSIILKHLLNNKFFKNQLDQLKNEDFIQVRFVDDNQNPIENENICGFLTTSFINKETTYCNTKAPHLYKVILLNNDGNVSIYKIENTTNLKNDTINCKVAYSNDKTKYEITYNIITNGDQ